MMGWGTYGGMMGYGYGYWSIGSLLGLVLLVGLILLVYLGVIKLWRELFTTKGKK